MKYRLFLLLATFSLGCLAQLHLTGVRDAARSSHEIQLAIAAAPSPNDSSVRIELPPVSAVIENGALSLVIDPLSVMTQGSSSQVTERSSAVGAFSGEHRKVLGPDILLSSVYGNERSQATTNPSNSERSNAVEPRTVTLPIKMSDVTGLNAAISNINSSLATLTTTVTNLGATVNTLSAQVRSLVPVPTFVDFEVPTGSIDGSNPVFVLSMAPSPPSSLVLCKNGIKLFPGGDYSLSGQTILFASPSIPQAGDMVTANYRH